MAAALFRLPTSRVIDSNGIADGSTLTFYDTGTLTPRAVYTTDALSVEHPNPLTVAAGAAVPNIYLNDAYTYRCIVKNALGTTIDDIDPYTGFSASGLNFLQAGTGAVAETAQAAIRRAPIYPEQFGAVANGTTNDAPAIARALAAAIENDRPLAFTLGKTYGVGEAAWTGFDTTLTKDLTILGNGATIKVLVRPTLSPITGSGAVLLKFDGTASKFGLTVHGLKFDLGGTQTFALSPYRCKLDIQDCTFTNGDKAAGGTGNGSICVNANACSGLIAGNYSKNVGYMVYMGHTDAAMFSDGLRIIGNQGEQFYNAATPAERGDFCVGVVKNSVIAGNVASGFYSAVALASFNTTAMGCENIAITGNVFADGTASGVQTDVVGGLKIKNVTVTGNTFKNLTDTALMLKNAEKCVVGPNEVEGCRYGLSLDNSTDITVTGGRYDWTGAATAGAGIIVSTSIGHVSRVAINGVLAQNFTDGAGIIVASNGGAGFLVTNVTITGCQAFSNANGIIVQDPTATGLTLDGNTALSNVTKDLRCDAQDCVIGSNRYATEQSIQYFSFTNADTTPSVKGRTFFRAGNTAPTTITNLDDGVDGQQVIIYAADANTTIAHGGNHDFPASANITLAAGEMVTLRRNDTIWRVENRR